MNKLQAAVKSMRLRTLPLSTGGVLLGILLAVADYQVNVWVAVLIVLTTVFLQILSNLSNELGDVLHGTDTADRKGPQYGLNGGVLTIGEMKVLIGVFVGLCIVSGTAMTLLSFGTLWDMTSVLVLLMGASAIMGAMKYTLGRNPYGYRGLGDFYVFLFFGLVAVLGGYFVSCHTLFWRLLLPGAAVGCFSVGVLNVNNIRDMETDAANRVTVAIRLGERNAKIYQTALIILGWLLMLAYCQLRIYSKWHYLFVLTLPLFVLHIRGVWKRTGKALDPMLPLLVISTFLFCLLAGVGLCLYGEEVGSPLQPLQESVGAGAGDSQVGLHGDLLFQGEAEPASEEPGSTFNDVFSDDYSAGNAEEPVRVQARFDGVQGVVQDIGHAAPGDDV